MHCQIKPPSNYGGHNQPSRHTGSICGRYRHEKVTVHQGDSTLFTPVGVTVVAMYLYPPVIAELMPILKELPSGTRIISYAHDLPGVNAGRFTLGDHEFFMWAVP